MRKKNTSSTFILLILLFVPLLLFVGSTLIIVEIERSTEINIDEIEVIEDLYKIKSIESAIHLRIFLDILDTLSKIFTGETIIEKLYRIQSLSFIFTIIFLILIFVGFYLDSRSRSRWRS